MIMGHSKTSMADLRPGDILVISDRKWTSFFVKLQAFLKNESAQHNHIAIVHHTDEAGTIWAIEGRPSGTGWADAESYLKSPFTKTNAIVQKNRSDEERAEVAKILEGMIGTPYDWSAIIELGMDAINADRLWKAKEWGENEIPTHVICSSLADWAYQRVGWASPSKVGSRYTTPAHWYEFISQLERQD